MLLHEGHDAVAGAVALARGLLAARQHGLHAVAEVHDDVAAALEAPHHAGDDLADAVLVVVEHALALGVAHALDDDLLGRLRGDAAEALALLRDAQEVPEEAVLLAGALHVTGQVEDLEASSSPTSASRP
jgi:hypothetical protein